MNKVVVIRKEEDFDKIRSVKGCEKLTVFILSDVDFGDGNLFLPIDLSGTEVSIYGLGNTLSNLTINNFDSKQVGLFSSVKNLYVKKLKVIKAKVNGDEVCGVLAGHVDESFIADELYMDSDVDCHAISGGVIGSADTVFINESTICSSLSGVGVLGGIAGMADNCFVNESIVNTTFKPKSKYAGKRSLIDTYVGYLGSREGVIADLMVEEVFKSLEEKNSMKLVL